MAKEFDGQADDSANRYTWRDSLESGEKKDADDEEKQDGGLEIFPKRSRFAEWLLGKKESLEKRDNPFGLEQTDTDKEEGEVESSEVGFIRRLLGKVLGQESDQDLTQEQAVSDIDSAFEETVDTLIGTTTEPIPGTKENSTIYEKTNEATNNAPERPVDSTAEPGGLESQPDEVEENAEPPVAEENYQTIFNEQNQADHYKVVDQPPVTQERFVYDDEYIRRKTARAAVTGGVVGYMVGRRGGRKRAEKRFRVERKQLAHEINQLKDNVEQKESLITEINDEVRKLKVNTENSKKQEQIIQSLQQEKPLSLKLPENRPETVVNNLPPEEVLAVERKVSPETITRSEESLTIKQPSPEAPAATNLSYEAQLEIAKQIEIDGVSLRQIYESGRLTKEGLKNVLETYIKGDNVEFSLRREIMGDEFQLARQAEHRFDGQQQTSPVRALGGLNRTDSMSNVEDVSLGLVNSQQVTDRSVGLKSQASTASQQNKKAVSVSSAIVVGVLAGLVAVLLLFA
jgi:hypothetical protein